MQIAPIKNKDVTVVGTDFEEWLALDYFVSYFIYMRETSNNTKWLSEKAEQFVVSLYTEKGQRMSGQEIFKLDTGRH